MTQEEKQLLLKDLCARLLYGVKVDVNFYYATEELSCDLIQDLFLGEKSLRPYLRSMSSMTREERIEFSKLLDKRYCEEDWEGHISTSYCIEINNVYTDDENGIKFPSAFSMDAIDWLNAHHFDYRNLIEKGLALEAPEGMYKTN